MAEPWLRVDRVVDAVSEWTGVSRKRLLTPYGSELVQRARTLLIFALCKGVKLSRHEALIAVGYSATGGNRQYAVFERDVDPEEIEMILKLARELQGV